MNNVNMANMGAMGAPMGGAPMPMMNNGAMPPHNAPRQQGGGPASSDTRAQLNTYIYEYFLRSGMFECARALLNSDNTIKLKDDGHRDENGNLLGNGLGDDAMDHDSKDPKNMDLPLPNIPQAYPESCFLVEWFSLFFDIFNAQKNKGHAGPISQYVAHTQNQTRMRQQEQQQMMRNLRPELSAQYQQRMLQNLGQNGQQRINMMKPNTLHQAAMANNNQNPQMQLLQKQAQMQGNAADMEANRARPSSPGSADNAPSPKRPRLEGPGGFNQGMMPNGRQQMQGQGNPHHGNQMPNKPMPNPNIPQGQGSPMVPQGPDGATIQNFYNQGDMNQGNMRPGGPAGGQAGGSNHALQDYQMQLMLLEQQNKKRLMMARQEQDIGVPGPPGANGPPFQTQSPPGGRPGASPGPEQLKRGPQMNAPSPIPEGMPNRSSPNPMNFMPGPGQQVNVNPNGAPHFFNKEGMEMNMANAQMNGNMRPPSSHPGGQPFNGPMNAQMMQQRAQQQQGGPGGPQQWQQGPNGQMGPQGPQPQMGTPQQRAMPPPSAPAANNANSRNTTSSPQVTTAAPPTPSQANKAAPKKKESKNSKNAKTAANKKSNPNLNNSGATPAAEPSTDAEPPTPATPITPVPPAGFGKAQNAGAVVVNGQQSAQAPAPPPVPQQHPDPAQAAFNMDGNAAIDFSMDFANPLTSENVLDGFDFDSFLHDGTDEANSFDFSGTGAFSMEGGEIGAD